jgi:hypothetical protein
MGSEETAERMERRCGRKADGICKNGGKQEGINLQEKDNEEVGKEPGEREQKSCAVAGMIL